MKKLLGNRWLRWTLGLVMSLFLLYLAFRTTSFVAVWAVLRQAKLGWVVAALVCILATSLIKVIRWQVMLGAQGKHIHYVDLLMANLSGQMLNAVFPVRIGDVSRAVVIGGEGPGWAFVLGSVALEKIFDLIWFALLIVLLLVLIPLPGWVGHSIWISILAAFILCGLTFLMTAQRWRFMQIVDALANRWPSKLSHYIAEQLRNGLDSLDVLQQRHGLIKIAILTTIIWGAALVTNYLVLLSLGIQVSLSASVLILVGLTIGINVAVVPGRIGVFEWICVLALALYGVSRTEGLSYGLLLHALVYIPTILLGVLSLLILARGRQKYPSQPSSPSSDQSQANASQGID